MVEAHTVSTGRIATHVLEVGEGEPVVFVHGNLSDAEVWREQLELLPAGYRGVAVDLRGYGRSEVAPVDATRGVDDFADDLAALVDALDLGAVHLVAHSLGAGVVYRYATMRPEAVRTITVIAPMSPHGFGGCRPDGRPWTPDGAGSGGGTANADFVARLAAGDRGDDDPSSPRNVIRTVFFPSPDAVRDEDAILDSMLRAAVGEDSYPGDVVPSEHWPGVAVGRRGVLNAISPVHLDVSGFADSACRAPVLWVRGAADVVIADASLLDLGHLGALGAVPDWPGPDVAPAQPMDAQTRRMLAAYGEAGGDWREVVLDTGHFVFASEPQKVAELLAGHLRADHPRADHPRADHPRADNLRGGA